MRSARQWLWFVTTLVLNVAVGVCPAGELSQATAAKGSPFVDVLWLAQHVGRPAALAPQCDVSLKADIARALRKDFILTTAGAAPFMTAEVFKRFAGEDQQLDLAEIHQALAAQIPAMRKSLFPNIATHLDLLTTSFDLIDERHCTAGADLVDAIVENYQPGRVLPLIGVCTGNSRRSILVSTMVNVAALYYGLPEIQGYSGGTRPSAFNSRTVATLQDIGVQVETAGREAPRGSEHEENPIYNVRWGTPSVGLRTEAQEFSKKYNDLANPQAGFIALMTCGEADASCPTIKGAVRRVSMPYLDPKLYDGTEFEARKYAERRDDIGRLMLAVMLQVRLRLAANSQSGAADRPN